MRVLVIGQEERASLGKIKEFAESNVLSFDDLLDIKNNTEPNVGNRPNHWCIIPDNFRVVYSVEMHPNKDGSGFTKLRAMSMSVPNEGKLPNPDACNMVMIELGFKGTLEDCYVRIENDENDVPHAILIIEEF